MRPLGDLNRSPKRAQSTSDGRAVEPATSAADYPFRWYFLLILVLGLGLYSQIGLQGTDILDPNNQATLVATLHKDVIWLLTFFGLAIHCGRHGFKYLGWVLAPFVPMAVLGLVSSAFGIDPVNSFRLLIYWSMCLAAGSLVALEVPPQTVKRTMFWMLFAELAISILVVIVLPQLGRQIDIRVSDTWRGVFTNKNILGWVTVWSLIAAWFFRREVGRLPALAMGAMALLCLYKAHSQGSVMAVILVVALLILFAKVRKMSMSALGKSTLTISVTVIFAVSVILLAGTILPLLGRDTTLTGRTDVWREFMAVAVRRWPIGYGPGTFTVVGPIIDEMAKHFAYIGGGIIRTPHNMYIATFGEGGVAGIAAYIGALIYLGFVEPFKRTTLPQLIAAVAALAILAGGLIETHEVYEAGFSLFLLFVMRGMASSRHSEGASVALTSTVPNVAGADVQTARGPTVLGGRRPPLPLAGQMSRSIR